MPKIIKGIALAALVLSLNGCYSRANTFVAGNYSIRLEWLGVHGIKSLNHGKKPQQAQNML